MKKVLAGAALALASLAASADTITLFPTSGFGNLSQWHDIANSEGMPGLYIYFTPASGNFILFQAPDDVNIAWSCSGAVQGAPMNCSDNVARSLAFTYHEVVIHPKVCSGRGCGGAKTFWYLDSGTVVTP